MLNSARSSSTSTKQNKRFGKCIIHTNAHQATQARTPADREKSNPESLNPILAPKWIFRGFIERTHTKSAAEEQPGDLRCPTTGGLVGSFLKFHLGQKLVDGRAPNAKDFRSYHFVPPDSLQHLQHVTPLHLF
jgi:hypothetical protein